MKRLNLLGSLVAATALAAPAAAQSVAGSWDAAMNTPGGVVNYTVVFEQRGDTLTGTVKRSAGDVPLQGWMSHDTVTFSWTITYNDNPFTLTATARLVGDSLKGSVDFSGQGADDFWAARARKVPPPAGGAPPDRSSVEAPLNVRYEPATPPKPDPGAVR